jgi:hypothetical protein
MGGTLVRGEQVSVTLAVGGDQGTLLGAPITITARLDWAEYRQFGRERFGV